MRRLLAVLFLLLSVAMPLLARGQAVVRVASVTIEGRLLDDRARLVRFIGLEPGTVITEETQRVLGDSLKVLGYSVIEQHFDPSPEGIRVRLKLEPSRVLRKVYVHGNWPVFDDEILRHVSVRSGDTLKPDDELQEFLDQQAKNILSYLERDGFFDGSVKIVPHLPRPADHPEWVDLHINVSLGTWYRLGRVVPTFDHPLPAGKKQAITEGELFNIFSKPHCCFFWSRFTIDHMRDNAREAERLLRDRGYPGARVIPEFSLRRDADPKTRRIALPVKVIEKRKVEVKFFGNRALTDKDLRDQLTIFTNGAYDDVELGDSARAVQRFYQQHGYFEARVTFTRERLGGEKETVNFLIDEGQELKVRGVEVVSDTGAPLAFSPDEIRARAEIETKPFPTLGVIGLGEGGYVTSLQLQNDVDRIVEFYKQRGFPKVSVHAEVARDPASFASLGALGAETAGSLQRGEDLYVRFVVDEGYLQSVGDVDVEFIGRHTKTKADVLRVLRMIKGRPFTEEAFNADQQNILNLYKSSGRPYLVVTYVKSHWDEAQHRFYPVYEIDEDGDVRFGEIMIRGNFKTLDRVILKDLPFRKGDRFDISKIETGERNLRTHLIFNSVEVRPVYPADHTRPVPVLVRVQERYLERAGSFGVGGGFATDKLPYYSYLQVGWFWKNFAGLGSEIEAKFDTGFSSQSFGASLRYTDLRAFGPGWRFDFNGFYRRDITFRLGPIETYGASVGLTRYLTPSTRLFSRFDIYRAQIGVGFNRVDGPNDTPTVQDNTTTSKVAIGVVWDRRVGADGLLNALAPTKGWLMSASLGWATPYLGSDHQFILLSGQVVGLLPFRIRSSEFTLMGNLRFDEGIPVGESALPLVERFFAGGDTTTRGYDTDSLRSEIIRSTVSPLAGAQSFRVVPQGGNIRLLSTIEIQFPIAKTFFGLPFPWLGAIFYDAGAIVDGFNLMGWSDVKHSVGVALLRLFTPVGALSLEYAYPLSQSLAEERWKTSPWYSHYPGRIHFNWGIPLQR